VTQQNNSAFFSQASQALNAISSSLKGLQGTSVGAQYDGLSLQGTNQQLNVFNLSNINWSGIRYLNIDAPSTSQVLVNIAGQSVSWTNMGFGLTGVTRHNVLYNLYDAKTLEASAVGIQGSILATQASFVGHNGQYNGQGIFKEVLDQLPTAVAAQVGGPGAVTGYSTPASIQGNYAPNNATDPASMPGSGAGETSVPTPSLLGGLVSLGLAAWRKRRQNVATAA
jgi:hypothetical protein